MYTRIFSSIVALLVFAQCAFAEPGTDTPRQLEFEVFLDDRPIGYQRFALAPAADGIRVESRAEFAVKVLGITAFEYAHRNVEKWRGRCLHSIESSTNSNGTSYRVSGRAGADGFVLAGDEGQRRLAECVGTFAYWDKTQLLGRERLLNPQTGDHQAVEVRRIGTSELRLGGREVNVEQFELRGEGIDVVLSYATDSGEWLALDSQVTGNRVLRYRRSMGPRSLSGAG